MDDLHPGPRPCHNYPPPPPFSHPAPGIAAAGPHPPSRAGRQPFDHPPPPRTDPLTPFLPTALSSLAALSLRLSGAALVQSPRAASLPTCGPTVRSQGIPKAEEPGELLAARAEQRRGMALAMASVAGPGAQGRPLRPALAGWLAALRSAGTLPSACRACGALFTKLGARSIRDVHKARSSVARGYMRCMQGCLGWAWAGIVGAGRYLGHRRGRRPPDAYAAVQQGQGEVRNESRARGRARGKRIVLGGSLWYPWYGLVGWGKR